MTLAQITQFINDKIRNKIPKVVKIELADVQQAIVNEIYADEIIETQSVGIVFDKAKALADDLIYEINIKKVGKTVFLNGYIVCISNVINQRYTLNIINNDFKPVALKINDLSSKVFSNETVLGYAVGLNYETNGNEPQIIVFKINGLPFNGGQFARVFGFYTTQN